MGAKAYTTEFDATQLREIAAQLRLAAGRIGETANWMEEKDETLWIFNNAALQQGLPWVVSFSRAVVDSLERHIEGIPYDEDSSKGRVSKKKKAAKKKSPKKK